MLYPTPEIIDLYHQRVYKQSQNARICRYANVKRASFLCRILHAIGILFVFIGLELKRMSRTPAEPNGVSIFYEYS